MLTKLTMLQVTCKLLNSKLRFPAIGRRNTSYSASPEWFGAMAVLGVVRKRLIFGWLTDSELQPTQWLHFVTHTHSWCSVEGKTKKRYSVTWGHFSWIQIDDFLGLCFYLYLSIWMIDDRQIIGTSSFLYMGDWRFRVNLLSSN